MSSRQLGHGISGQGIDGRSGHGIDGRSMSGRVIRDSSQAMTTAATIGTTTLPTPPATWRAA